MLYSLNVHIIYLFDLPLLLQVILLDYLPLLLRACQFPQFSLIRVSMLCSLRDLLPVIKKATGQQCDRCHGSKKFVRGNRSAFIFVGSMCNSSRYEYREPDSVFNSPDLSRFPIGPEAV